MYLKLLVPISISILYCVSVHAQYGCTDPSAINYNASATINDGSCQYPITHDNPVLRCALQSTIKESSGVVWSDGKLWTHNDSGNPNTFFSIDTSNGGTLQKIFIDNYPNNDWEDITADDDYIYLEDAGNNNGIRTNLKILKIAKSSIGSATTVHVNADAISFSYTDQTSFSSNSTTNFDCESLISINDSLYLFTKDRGDLKTRVYKLPKTPGTYSISPYTNYNVNGLITGADYNPAKKEIVLIGYMSGALNSFIWVLNDFEGDLFFSGNKRRIEIGSGQEWQTEGICYISDNRYFISCEKSGAIDASLFVDNKNWLTSVSKTNGADELLMYPNPASDFFYIKNVPVNSFLYIRDMSGRILMQKNLKTEINAISIKDLAPGIYFAEIENRQGEKMMRKIWKQ